MEMVDNFRDIGGITNKNGQMIVKDIFFRSGELSKLTPEQSDVFCKDYRLQKVVDFRSEKEVKEQPDVISKTVDYIHIDILGSLPSIGASEEYLEGLATAQNAVDFMTHLYTDIAVNEQAQKGYHTFFEEILSLQPDKGILFHCFAGKDRTGIAAALVLEVLEVSKDKIYADYLKTNEMRKEANEALFETLKKQKDISPEYLKALKISMNVDAKFLDTFYQTIDKNYGDIHQYLNQELKLKKEMIEEMQKRFLVTP